MSPHTTYQLYTLHGHKEGKGLQQLKHKKTHKSAPHTTDPL